jgi:hypothetical protein
MRRPPFAVVVAAILTALQGVLVLLVTAFIGLVWAGWEHEGSFSIWTRAAFGLAGLLGLLLISGAAVLLSGNRGCAVAVMVFDVLVLALEIAPLVKPSDSVSLGSVLSPGGGVVVMWNLAPLICLSLPSSRRWSRH